MILSGKMCYRRSYRNTSFLLLGMSISIVIEKYENNIIS